MVSKYTAMILLMILGIPFLFCAPIFLPLMFWLYSDLLKYSSETIIMLSSGELVGTVPVWVNTCLDASTQITPPSDIVPFYDLGNELTQARIIYS